MNLLRRKDGDAADRSGTRLPRVPGPVAAAAVGMLCALLSMLLVFLGERGCDAVRGAPSCGNAGVLLLAVTGAVVLLVGFALLRALDAPDPGITNFLGFALFVIVLMTALLDRIFSSVMWIVLPLLGMVCYAVAAWISNLLIRMSQA